MVPSHFRTTPDRSSYDVVIIGGAMYGSSVAWFLTDNPDFDGRILVVERDPSYEKCATAHTNSCIRQQFSNPLNVQISQFGAEFINGFHEAMGCRSKVTDISTSQTRTPLPRTYVQPGKYRTPKVPRPS